ncbi:MAG: TonB-dependent starch-binding outer membrane protein SusC [Bacteroidota bacterium]|nr:TonB-dependent starch-binding outer membrane protein SusC [Bacteroidota bacterium]
MGLSFLHSGIHKFGMLKRFRAWSRQKLTLCTVILIIAGTMSALGQNNMVIKGTITDAETKKPLKSATVQIPNLRMGAITDEKGEFYFEAPPGEYSIEVKFVGYQTETRKINGKTGQTINFNLAIFSHAIQTSEVLVVGLTGEVDRDKLGNTITSVSGKDVSRVVSSSAIDALSGRVPGAFVTKNSGTPGAGTYINIRGRRTIMGSSEPLYVIDGIIMDNSSLYDGSGNEQFSNRAVDINPMDVESVEILKGASAAAMYGSKAANGVVIITTKKGKYSSYDKPAQISYSSSYQYDRKAGSIPLQTTFGQKPNTHNTYDYTIDPQTGLTVSKKLPDGTPTYKQDDVPFRDGFTHEQSLTVTGGVPQFDYLLNGTYLNTQGYVIGSDYERSSIRANLGISLLPRVSVQTNNNFIMINNNLPQDGSNVSGILLGGLRTPPEFDNSIYENPDGSQHQFWVYDNPLWTQHNNKFNSKIERFLHSTEIKWLPVDWINLTGRFGLDRYEYTNFKRLAVGSGGSENLEGQIDENRYTTKQYNLDFAATVSQKFFDDALDMSLVLGSQLIWYDNTTIGGYATSTLKFYDQLTAGSTQSTDSYEYHTKTAGYFGQLTSSLWNRLSLTLGMRIDGSSTFGKSNKFHYYPKVGFSYKVSDESFMKDLKSTLSTLRLRASWGEAGSPSLPGVYATNFLYGTSGFFDPWERVVSSAARGGFNGIRQGGGTSDEYIIAGAENINPELTVEKEIGLDLGFFDDRLIFEATYYYMNVFDMIVNAPVAASTGYDQELRNAAEMYNEGIELSLRATPYQSPDLTWTTMVNYSTNRNMVTKLDISPQPTGREYISITGGFTGIFNVAMKDQPLGVFMGYGWLKDENGKYVFSGNEIRGKKIYDDKGNLIDIQMVRAPNGGIYRSDQSQGDTSFAIGDYYGRSLTNAPIKDDNMQVLGNSNPDFMFSWKNEITFFEDLTISFLFDAVYGFDVWNGTKGAIYRHGTSGDTEDRDSPWFNFDNQPVTNSSGQQISKLLWYNSYGNGFNINEPFIEDGSYIKLREILIEYRWHGLKEWNINTVAFTLSARNIFTITNYTGFDPEVSTFSQAEGRGIDYFTLPQIRSYRFGISITY